MAILSQSQEDLLANAGKSYRRVQPYLDKLQREYEYAVYQAKRPTVLAVEAATTAAVPYSRIMAELEDFKYPKQLKDWLAPAAIIADEPNVKPEGSELTGDIEAAAGEVEDVTRDPRTGVFTVTMGQESYEVRAMGEDDVAWAPRDEAVPQEAYDLIIAKHPAFVVLGEDD